MYGHEWLERLAAAKTPLWDFPGQTVAFATKDNADSVKQFMFLHRFEPGEGKKDLWLQRGTEIVLVLQELALDIGDFSFHVVDLQKKLTEKQEGEKASGDSFEHFVLF